MISSTASSYSMMNIMSSKSIPGKGSSLKLALSAGFFFWFYDMKVVSFSDNIVMIRIIFNGLTVLQLAQTLLG